MKKHLFILSCLLFIPGGLFAQSLEKEENKASFEVVDNNVVKDNSVDDKVSSAPAARAAAASSYLPSDYASLAAGNPTQERRVSSNVDYYTGTANVNVSLYTISSYGIEIPIVLQYAASGLKVDSYPTWVGINWNLTGGGRITRVVNGQPDETGFLKGHGASAANSNAEDWKSSEISKKLEEDFDGEPDLYHYELPTGQSGMFVINYDKKISLIPYQDVKVEWMNNSDYSNSYFVVTDAQGVKYYFGTTADSRESAYNADYERTKAYVSGWMLDYMSYGGKELARYTYRMGTPFEKNLWNYLYRFEYKPATNAHKSLTTLPMNLLTKVYPRVLTSITWDLGKLEFDSRDADDYIRTGPSLLNIRVYGYKNEYLKNIYFELGNSGTTVDRVYEEAGSLQRTICSFEYFYSPTNFPDGGTVGIDYWGYYNGQKIGEVVTPEHTILGYKVAGQSRAPNLECTKYRSLHKIIYPNGGWTEFEYELHQGRLPTPGIQSEWNGPLETAGGLRIKSITHYASPTDVADKVQYIYQDPNDTKKGGQIYSSYKPYPRIRKDEGSGANRVVTYSVTKKPDHQMADFTGSSVVYNYVKEVLPNGSYNTYEFGALNYSPDNKGQAALSTSGGINAYVADTQDKVPSSTKFFARGLLEKKSQYSSTGTLLYSESYTYAHPAPKSSVYAYPLFTTDEESSPVKYYKGRYEWISQPTVLQKKTVSGTNEPRYSVMYSYHPSYNDLSPRAIYETDAMGNYYTTTITYPQDYTVLATSTPTAETHGLYWLQQNGVKSAPIETIKYKRSPESSDEKVIGAMLNLYKWSDEAKRYLLGETKNLVVSTPLGTAITPMYVSEKTLVKDPRYNQYNSQTTSFNDKGNPTFTNNAGPNSRGVCILYGYDGHIPVASVKGINGRSAIYTSFEEETTNIAVFLGPRAKSGDYALNKNTPYTVRQNVSILSYWRWDGNENTKWEEVRIYPTPSSYTILEPNHYVDEVRVLPPGASMETQITKPGVGVISCVDESGAAVRFNYNHLGMLESIARDGQIVERYSYAGGSEIHNLSASVASGSTGRGQAFVNPAQVSAGGSATFSTTYNTGYQFSQWQFSDGTSSTDAVTVKTNIRSDLSGVASFIEVKYNLSASVASGSSGYGQASVSPAQVTIGGSATWTASAYSGYTFNHWTFSDGTTAYTPTTTKTGISQNITGTAYFEKIGPKPVDFNGTIMPREGYWAIHIGCTPDIISYGDVKVSFSGYFFINPDQPNEDVVPVSGEVGEDGYILSNAPFDENGSVGKLNGQISFSNPNYTVGTVSWH